MPPAESPTLNLQDIEETLWKTTDKLRNNLVLTPGRYVGSARVQFTESDRRQRAIREHSRALGHEI